MTDASWAAQLLSRSPNSQVTDMLVTTAGALVAPVELASPPSRTVMNKAAKGPVMLAVSLASSPTTPAAVLQQLVKDKRKTVWRALAANPSVPQEALREIQDRAVAERDDETLAALLGTRDLREYLPVVRHRVRWPQADPDRAVRDIHLGLDSDKASRLVAEHVSRLSRDDAVACLPLLPGGVLYQLAARTTAGTSGAVTFADLAERAQTTNDVLLISAGAWRETAGVVADEAVDMVVDIVTAAGDTLPTAAVRSTSFRGLDSWLWDGYCTSSPGLSARAVHRIVESGVPQLLDVLAQSIKAGRAAADQPVLQALTDAPSPVTAARLLGSPVVDQLTDAQYDRCVRLLAHNTYAAEDVLESSRPLSKEALLAALRSGNILLTARWLSGQLPHPATGQEFLALCEVPGFAFIDMRYGTSSRSKDRQDPIVILQWLVEHLKWQGDATDPDTQIPPAALLEVGWVLVRYAHEIRGAGASRRLADWVTDTIAVRLPATVEAWQMAIVLSGTITSGTIDDFCTTVAVATGAADTGPAYAEPEPVEPDPVEPGLCRAEPVGQLALL